ncbi:hypothetical protein A3D00_02755 [Candidatus Woesebacteria bacterium RIFCSPHIGHO2_02_FULL_38_9]|uniref:ROK family protein n=1 Tax=Candidatus Woesebacteria bacterium RIFCSPHIGHO2_01_FULL_39_28 TaxID=1802496 RepID=A0A1F7YE90_9BACT|nr:MAG: hypothetical protein A2627_04345 [Candidatus Woesebacteria bacterium RIFCSPHIGHO2_01_FULL_39_28]OGM35170.1 MAG: hypothetical protein A3D00_02755 [Candidatus Woesebacteria bacterium RIFCSPHIGHO2_02_FULL_38_9]OGM57760.1 MAG: hypothetical protein A3A50_05605 [Candidatus Woesebacteria bacterium RIFCSPLOWO2_01_FULL_38_20]
MANYFLFDIGGTNTRIALSTDGTEVGEAQIFPTPKTFDEGIKLVKEVAEKTLSQVKIDLVAGGIAGPLNLEKSEMVRSPNLSEWIGKPFKEELQKIFNCPVYVENDAAMIGLGESISGAAKGFRIVAFMVMGTGVGGARIVDQRIDDNIMGFEIGHQIINIDLLMDLEDYIGGRSLEKKYNRKPFDIDEADEIWDDVARQVAAGVNNMIVHWSPDVILLGGSVSRKINLDKVSEYLKQMLTIFPESEFPPIKKTSLGDLGGLYGALHYLNNLK